MTNEEKLKEAYTKIVWMAMRYANGRSTYAPCMVRKSIKTFQEVFPDWKPRKDNVLKIDRKQIEGYKDRNGEGLGLYSDWLDDLA